MKSIQYTFSKLAVTLIICSLISMALIVVVALAEYNIGLNKIIYNSIRILGALIIGLTILYGLVNVIEAIYKKLNIKKFFKKTELNLKKQTSRHYRFNPLLSGLVIFLGITAFSFIGSEIYKANTVRQATYGSPSPQIETSALNMSSPVLTPSPRTLNKKNVDQDPIVNCGPGQTSKQYVKDKQSNCKNYVDCGLNNNTVWTMMIKSECDKKHAEASSNTGNTNTGTYSYTPTNYPPCTIYYPALKRSETYNYTSPETCQLWKNQTDYSTTQTFTQPSAPSPIPSPIAVDYSDYCQQQASASMQRAQVRFGDSSAYHAVISIIQNSIYPKCLETGVWQE